jgi:hypothetical protein
MIQIKCCLQEWESGQHINVPFTGEAFSHDNDGILKTIAQVEAHPYHGPSYQNAKKGWARSGMCVSNFIYFYIFILRCLIPVHVLLDQAEHRLSIITLRRYWIELGELWYYRVRIVSEPRSKRNELLHRSAHSHVSRLMLSDNIKPLPWHATAVRPPFWPVLVFSFYAYSFTIPLHPHHWHP